jgi:hypothetical protein
METMTSPSLYELQRAFIAATIDEEAQYSVLDARGLAVHRNNWRSNLCGALRITYPVVERLVGAEFFAYTANCFIDNHPSRSANLEDYGAEFAEFLQAFKPAQSLRYLADVARLEAAIENVLVAADDADARCLLHSLFPVLRIWQVNQPGWEGDDSVNLESGPDYLLIYRAEQDVLIEPVDRKSFDVMNRADALREADGV